MLPLQPLIWLIRRSFHTACEEACDDWAVATGDNPVDLADTLTAWINRKQRTASLVAIGMSSTSAHVAVTGVVIRRFRTSATDGVGLLSRWHFQ